MRTKTFRTVTIICFCYWKTTLHLNQTQEKDAIYLLHCFLLLLFPLLPECGGHGGGGGGEGGLVRPPAGPQTVQVAHILAVVYGVLEEHLGHLEECLA